MSDAMDYLPETSSQTAGPYVHIGLAPKAAGFDIFDTELHQRPRRPEDQGRADPHRGTRARRLRHAGERRAARDLAGQRGGALQPPGGSPGQDRRQAFRGWGRACSDFTTGVYTFDTIKPGAVMGRNGRPMAPHVNLWLVARGINLGLNTRMYFSDEAAANAKDPVLNLIEWEVRRKTLIGERAGGKGRESTASTSICRAPTRRCSSTSESDDGTQQAMVGNFIDDVFDGIVCDPGSMPRNLRRAFHRDGRDRRRDPAQSR